MIFYFHVYNYFYAKTLFIYDVPAHFCDQVVFCFFLILLPRSHDLGIFYLFFMPISFSTLDTSLDALRLTTEKKTFIIAEIQRVLIDHIMSHRLDPSGLFQMEICLDHDVRRTSDPKMQTHLIIDFGNKPIHP